MTNEAKVLLKIKKLLALSTSSNEHEAALAAEKAHELLMEHKLSLADVEAVSTDRPTEEVGEADYEWGKTYIDKWRDWLVVGVAKAFHCKVIRRQMFSRGRVVRGYTFIGKPTDTSAAIAMQGWLTAEIERLTAQSGLPTWQKRWSFTCGAALKVMQRLRDTYERRQQENPKYGALVVVDDKAVTAYMKQHYPRLRTTSHSKSSRWDADAFRMGSKAGETVALGGRPLGRQMALIGG